MAYADELNWNIDSEKLYVSSSSVHSFDNFVHSIEAEASTTNPAGSLLFQLIVSKINLILSLQLPILI